MSDTDVVICVKNLQLRIKLKSVFLWSGHTAWLRIGLLEQQEVYLGSSSSRTDFPGMKHKLDSVRSSSLMPHFLT